MAAPTPHETPQDTGAEPKLVTDHEGIRRLLHEAGADVSRIDLACTAPLDRSLGMDALARLSLSLSLAPELAQRRLRDVALDSALFAFECPNGMLRVFIPGSYGALRCLNPDTGLETDPPDPGTIGRALMLDATPRTDQKRGPLATWFGMTTDAASGTLVPLVALTVLSNLLGLALPLFTLAVYDQVLAAGDRTLLYLLAVGLLLSLLGDMLLRGMRSILMARTSGLVDLSAKSRLFGRLLRAPSLFEAGFGARASRSRLREIDRVRSFFIGPIGVAFVEAPFALLYVLALAYLAGWLALVPAAILVVGAAGILALLSPAVRRTQMAAQQADAYSATNYEIITGYDTIMAEGTSAQWLNRFREASARLAEMELFRLRTSVGAQVSASTLVSLAVLATLGGGASMAISGTLSVGALIASVALVWRMSAPLPSLMQGYLRWSDIRAAAENSASILNAALPPPRDNRLSGRGGGMKGSVAFSSVMMTYERGQTAALRNVSFSVDPGEIIAITGHAGAGKSTTLDLIAGMLEPQFGAVTIDGINPRQISQNALRQSIGYLKRGERMLPIPIADYLNLGVEVERRPVRDLVCRQMGILEQIEHLPLGFGTVMTSLDANSGLAKAIALTRVFLSDTNLILLDEPDTASIAARRAILGAIDRLRGSRTVIMATHSPELVSVADRLIVLNHGTLARICAPREIAGLSKVASQ